MYFKLSQARTAFTFDDFYLVPQYSTITSRKQPSTKTKIGTLECEIPIIASPMNTVTEEEMILTMQSLGATGVLHRYMSAERQVELSKKISFSGSNNFFVAIGATGDFLDRAKRLNLEAGVTNFCIDVANGHSKICIDAVKTLRKKIKDITNIMAGCVCTSDGVINLANAGCNIVRVGIGGGSQCQTRLVTGFGVPQLSALEDCVSTKMYFPEGISILADGGIRSSGDIVKALAIGADAVVVGGLLAGTEESPGEVHKDLNTGELYKVYSGMASEEGRQAWFDKSVTSFVPEGVSSKARFQGSAKKIVERLHGGIRVGMSYCSALTLEDLRTNAEFVRVTDNGRREGNPNKKMFK